MQEASGLIQDSSGLGHHATASTVGTITYHAGGPILTESSDFAIGMISSSFSIPDHADLDHGDTLTAEAWIYKSDAGVTRAISGRGSGALTWGTDASNLLFAARADIGGIVTSRVAFALNTWYHVAYTKATTTSKLYVNGRDVTGTVTNQTLVDVAVPLRVGSDYNDTLQWNGSLDEVAFYSTELSQGRIQAHYNAAIGQLLPPTKVKFIYVRKNK